MSRGPSWRLQFIDIDSSFTITTDASEIMGAMVVRAPKGETVPMYFPKGNTEAIEAAIGIPTADWPDIGESIAFNQEFGLYISAPAGSSSSYPSYYGGEYFTTMGSFPFYHVTDKSAPGYTIGLAVGNETKFDSTSTAATVSVVLSDASGSSVSQGTVYVSNISSKVYSRMQKLDFAFWGDDANAAGIYTYKIDKDDTSAGGVATLYCLDSDGAVIKSGDTAIVCGIVTETTDASTNKVTYQITLGGTIAKNSSTTSGIPFLNFASMGFSVLTKIQLKEKNNTTYVAATTYDSKTTYYTKKSDSSYTKVTLTSATYKVGTYYVKDSTGTTYSLSNDAFDATVAYYSMSTSTSYTAVEGLTSDAFSAGTYYVSKTTETNCTASTSFNDWIVNGVSTSDSYTYESTQYSFTEAISGVKSRLTTVEYVKDITMMYVNQKTPTEKVTNLTIDSVGYDKYVYDTSMKWSTDKSAHTALVTGDNYLVISKDANNAVSCKVYESNGTAADADTTDVSENFLTKVIKVTGTDILDTSSSTYKNNIFYINSTTGGKLQTATGEYPLKLTSDINFNTFTISCTESVYPGEQKTGCSSLQGSLDEEGQDSSGSNIYWLNVLPDDSLSFIEVKVNKTFDDYLDDNGCYTGVRVSSGTSFTLQGQRYVTNIVETNVENGYNGCATAESKFLPIVKLGWTEFNQSKYDGCYVMMEPTGYEDLKSILSSIRSSTLKLTTMISPKTITNAEFTTPSKITVSGRLTGTAQYVGEFQLKDAYTGRKYWIQPIGDVGVNLCRIIEKKYGGWAPMWNNITGGLGGQLNRAVLKAKWDFSDDATKVMDEKGINPIIYNADDGMMIVSQKTTQDPTNLTDWSYLGHSMAFDLLKREIRDNVMRPQIGKPNDSYWQNIRQQQVNAILDKRISGSQPIWAGATCDIAGVNTDAIKAQRKFAIYVKCKVNIFSEIVVLTLENISQTTSL